MTTTSISHIYVNLILIYLFVCYTGLGFRPLPPDDNVESTLIWYRGTDKENFKHWTESLNEFLEGIPKGFFTFFFCY